MAFCGSSVLPYRSRSNIGRFRFIIWADKAIGDVSVSLWATSSGHTPGSPSGTSYPYGPNWHKIGETLVGCSLTHQYSYIEINNQYFTSAKSIAMHLHTPTGRDVTASAAPWSIIYSTASYLTLLSDSAVGSFYWLAMDGGWSS